MEQSAQNHPEVYDFRQYDRIWQRVAPTLEPYPSPGRESTVQQEPAETASHTEASQMPGAALTPAQVRQESTLPGAERNPCCMGSAAAEMLEVLTGFVEGELADQRYYQTLARQAPSWARQQLRDIAADEGSHARRLMAVYFLITGECYRPTIHCDRIYLPGWCAALRERYHEEACGGFNYRRASQETLDPCLQQLLLAFSQDEYRHANAMLCLLSGVM